MLTLGLALAGLGLWLMTGVTVADGWTKLLAGFIVAGLGAGCVNPALANAAIGTVPGDKAGVGSGINNTSRQVGIAAGIAGLGAVFQSHIRSHFISALSTRAPALAGRSHALAAQVTSGQLTHALHGMAPHAQHAIAFSAKLAFISGFNHILWIGAFIAWGGAVLAALLVRRSDFVTHADGTRPVSTGHNDPRHARSAVRKPSGARQLVK
jgi:hypothetical protein